jgi:hypothetical protein
MNKVKGQMAKKVKDEIKVAAP